MRLKLAGAITAGILLTVLSAVPAGAATNTITLGPATLTDRVLITVPVTVVCDPLPPGGFFSGLIVTVTQASGQAVATGSFINESEDSSIFTCDSVTQNDFVVHVFPDPGSPPFHGGGACQTQ